MLMKKLAIIDYGSNTIHLYNADDDLKITPDVVSFLGFNPDKVDIMLGKQIDITNHVGILKP